MPEQRLAGELHPPTATLEHPCNKVSSSALQPHTARQEISKSSIPDPAFIQTLQRNTGSDLPVPIHAGMPKEMSSQEPALRTPVPTPAALSANHMQVCAASVI